MFIRKLKYTTQAQSTHFVKQFKSSKESLKKQKLFCQKICIDPHQEILALLNPFQNSVYIVKNISIFQLILNYTKNAVEMCQQKLENQGINSKISENIKNQQKQNLTSFQYSIEQPLRSQKTIHFEEKSISSFFFSKKFNDLIHGHFQYLAICFSERYKQVIQIFDVLNGSKPVQKYIFERPIINVNFFRKQDQQKGVCGSQKKLLTKTDQIVMFVSFYDGRLLKVDMRTRRQELVQNKMLILLRQRLNQGQIFELYQTHKFELCLAKFKLNSTKLAIKKGQQNKEQIREQINGKRQVEQKVLIQSGTRFFDYSQSVQQFQEICKLQMVKSNDLNDGYKNLIAYQMSQGQQFILARKIDSLQNSVSYLGQQNTYGVYQINCNQHSPIQNNMSQAHQRHLVNEQNEQTQSLIYQNQDQQFDAAIQQMCQSKQKPFISPFSYLNIRPVAFAGTKQSEIQPQKQSQKQNEFESTCFFIRIQQFPLPNQMKNGKEVINQLKRQDRDKPKVIAQVFNLKNQVRQIIWIGPLHLLFRDSKDNLFVLFIKQQILIDYLSRDSISASQIIQ